MAALILRKGAKLSAENAGAGLERGGRLPPLFIGTPRPGQAPKRLTSGKELLVAPTCGDLPRLGEVDRIVLAHRGDAMGYEDICRRT